MVELMNSIYSCKRSQLGENSTDADDHVKCIKCKRCHQRRFLEGSVPPIFLRPRHKSLHLCGFPKIMSRCRTSIASSLRFCLYGFVVWTLIVAPLLGDIARNIFLLNCRIPLGGVTLANACHPGSTNGGGTRPRPTVNLSPFQRNEYIPKMSEQTIGASGPAEGPIYRNTRRFKDELSPNWNPDIVFRDEEHTNEDRMMTKRCTDRLNVLAIWVANQWPGVKLRVTEGWDDPDTERIRSENALHYEGRAVDITTNDEDISKYPVLARLAVEAGFDWVYNKKFHVHCSVKSDSSDAALRGGCFPGDALVPVPGGEVKKMQELQPGDKVFSLDANGHVAPDVLLSFMDIQSDIYNGKKAERAFVFIATADGHTLHLTRNHLIYVSSVQIPSTKSSSGFINQSRFRHDLHSATAVFAGNVKVDQFVFVTSSVPLSNSSVTVRRSRVTEIEIVSRAAGAFAPLTARGTIVVDQALASCYAVIESDTLAHIVMTPTRYYHIFRQWLDSWCVTKDKKAKQISMYSNHNESKSVSNQEGISIYSKILYDIGYSFFSSSMFWGD